MSVRRTKLKGHKGSVTCLDHHSSLENISHCVGAVDGCLLSGSEDGTARVWDLRANPFRATHCIIVGEEVNAVHFCPLLSPTESEAYGNFSRDYSVLLAIGDKVIVCDLRHIKSPVVTLDDLSQHELLKASDDINHIALSRTLQGSNTYLAAADDSGRVQVVNLTSRKSFKNVLYHDPNQTAIVTSAVFRPRGKGLELASGGTDCAICLWDANKSKPRRPLSTFVAQQDTNGGSNQLCNPPMVHSLAWSPSGRLLAAALGSGCCSILAVENRSLVEVARLSEDGHESTVASVVFPCFQPNNSNRPEAQDRLLLSAGNDGRLLFWDLGATLAGDKAVHPREFFPQQYTEGEGNLKHLHENPDDAKFTSDSPTLIESIAHGEKPNWVVSSRNSTISPSTLYVADTTNDITAYIVKP